MIYFFSLLIMFVDEKKRSMVHFSFIFKNWYRKHRLSLLSIAANQIKNHNIHTHCLLNSLHLSIIVACFFSLILSISSTLKCFFMSWVIHWFILRSEYFGRYMLDYTAFHPSLNIEYIPEYFMLFILFMLFCLIFVVKQGHIFKQ